MMATTLNREPNATTTSVTSLCTCGHNYAMNRDDDCLSQERERQEDQSDASDQQKERCTSLPLDTSFVEIPMIHTIPRVTSMQHSRRNGVSPNIVAGSQEKLENENYPCSHHYTHCITQLYQAVSSNTETVPSLCRKCVQRYCLFR